MIVVALVAVISVHIDHVKVYGMTDIIMVGVSIRMIGVESGLRKSCSGFLIFVLFQTLPRPLTRSPSVKEFLEKMLTEEESLLKRPSEG